MSRSAHQRQQQKLQMQQQQMLAQQMADNEAAAAAAEMFDLFCVATTMRQILGLHRQMCDIIGLRPAPLNEFYSKLKTKVRSWKAQALWKKFDARAAHRAYAKGAACNGTRVLVIGAGPCGLRTAIEAQLLGAKVVVVEKRDRISRNNVLHLWPFVITDLRNLGAKKFYGKFCAGSIDHISIRQLQCILLKVALLLGVEIHEGVSFERTIEPSGDGCGWRASVTPADHAVSHYEFDVLIGADGKRNTLEAFKRKEFRGKLAIAITANFINKKTEAEAKAEEISGVAFIFNQSFFKELYHTTGIDLENIVYYKDETHYFVMTAKKHSLIDKGVILQDFADPAELLAPVNVNTEKLLDYAREAAEFSTKYQMPNLEFAVNHYGKPDVAMFDFTSMFAAESSCRVIVRQGFRLLQCLVGDSLLEPFWPTGSGCARGFLSSMDAAYTIKLWSNSGNSTLGVVAQRESIYRLLGQTTPENLQRDIGSYTVDPATRYPNLNRTSVNVWQVKHLIDTDDKAVLEQTFMDTNALQATQVDTPVRRKRRSGDTMPLSMVLLKWICAQLHTYEFINELKEVSDVFTNGKVLCALINRYRPDLVDFNKVKDLCPVEQNDLAFKILDKELHIPRIMSGKDSVQLSNLDSKLWLNYLEQICEVFRGEIPHVKHPKIDFSDLREKYKANNAHAQPDFSKLLQLSTKQKAKSPIQDLVDVPQVVQRRSVLDDEKLKRQRRYEQQFVVNATAAGTAAQTDTPRRAKKRRSADKAANISTKVALAFKKQAASEKCHFCKQTVYLMEKLQTENLVMHRGCLKCHHCHTNLRLGAYAFDRDDPNGRFYCTQHFRLPAKAIRLVERKLGQKKSAQQQQNEANTASPAIVKTPLVSALINSESGDEPKTPDKRGPVDNVAKLDLLERGQTPERIEFENTDAMSDGEPSEEHIIDEHEWSGRNFLPESNNDSESDLSSSDDSDSDSDSDMFEEANDSPLGAQTLQLASEWIGKQNYSDSDDSDDFYDSSEGMADDGKDDTEGEEFAKARELRREEVRLPPLPPNLPTDTETEIVPTREIPDNNSKDSSKYKQDENMASEIEEIENKPEEHIRNERKDSTLSNGSNVSYKSTSSLRNGNGIIGVTKIDIEKLEQNSDNKFRADIEAISEKLYRLNNVVKMNKDIETIAKENLIRSDILKKLSMKEKWLADNKIASKSKFEEKVDNFLKPLSKLKDDFFAQKSQTNEEKGEEKMQTPSDPFKPKSKFNDILTRPIENKEQKMMNVQESISKFKTEAEKNAEVLNLIKDLKNEEKHFKAKPDTLPSRQCNNIKNEQSQTNSKEMETEFTNLTVGRMNNLKGQLTSSSPAVIEKIISNSSKMELENVLNIVKKIDLSKSDANVNSKSKDMGQILYKVENKFSPKPNKKMVEKLKEIEAKSFSGTLDSIKSQIETPTISTQIVPSNVDLSKYFPNQKPEKSPSNTLNKNQKTLNEIDLTKYFPSSPVPQRKSSVVTVADKLRKSQTEKSLGTLTGSCSTDPKPPTLKNAAPKNEASLASSNYSLKDNQLDGAIDIVKKKPTVKVVTTTAVANSGKKGNVKIIRKIVPKGTKSKKNANLKKSLLTKNDDERILDEILESGSDAQRSPSLEYQQLFQEEKSPSDDISDKIERILEETGIDVGVTKKTPGLNNKKKKLTKTKSVGEEELQRQITFIDVSVDPMAGTKEEGDHSSGVQNLLKRFESLSSVPSSDHVFKLRRMESTLSNLNKSKESILSRESDNMSDLEKTMEYLKTEWRSEATNFLQTKRNEFHNKNKPKEHFEQAGENNIFKESPGQYEDSKLSKFFGLKNKTLGGRKSPIKKKKSPENKKSPQRNLKNTSANKSPAFYTSLEELALISVSKQVDKVTLNKTEITNNKGGVVPKTNVPEHRPEEELQDKQAAKSNKAKEEVPTNVRPLIEDIKNLPKTGCDKSLSSSRRSSLASLQSRRLSNASISDKLEIEAGALEKHVAVEQVNTDVSLNKSILNVDNYDTDSLCTSISKSPSVAPITAQRRGSSEEESIEKLFSQFSDEMLVNVEFDSNDELIAITPRSPIKKEEQSDQDLLDRVESLESDTDKESLVENKMPIKTSMHDFSFPIRPQRKQKSSSSDSTASLVPQRVKKQLSRLSPSDMPPSVQDLILAVSKSGFTGNVENNDATRNVKPLMFPRIIDEDDILLDESQTPCKYFAQEQLMAPKTNEEHLKCSLGQPSPIVMKSLNDGFETVRKLPEKVTEFTKVLKPVSPSKEVLLEENTDKRPSISYTGIGDNQNQSLFSEPQEVIEGNLQPKSNLTEPSLEWNMEMIPNSPMPPRRRVHASTKTNLDQPGSVEILSKLKKTETCPIDESFKTFIEKERDFKEKSEDNGVSLENQAEHTHISKSSIKSKESKDVECISLISLNDNEFFANLKDKSPTTSIKQLNNIDVNTEASQKRLIEEFELERRQALIQRDKQYQVMEKTDLKQTSSLGSSKSSSKKSTPLVTPYVQSPRDSRRSSIQSSTANRGGTPPMMKPLEILGSPSSQASRRSSFAFIELMDNKPVIAPMPKKLDLPEIKSAPEKPENLKLSLSEDVKKRPWPKLQEEEDEDDISRDENEDTKKFALETVEYANIPANSGPRRDWPDGKTVFSKKDKTRHKPRSETPEINSNSYDVVPLEKEWPCSKSITDLRKLQSPYNSNYSLEATGQNSISNYSYDNSEVSTQNLRSCEYLNSSPQKPTRNFRNSALGPSKIADDLSTQLLLERSKRLHNRKRDFVNERVVERNPYMKEVINEEKRNSALSKGDTDDGDIITTYRPKHIASRFPSSRALGRSNISSYNYDYVPSYESSPHISRRLPTLSGLPSTHNSLSSLKINNKNSYYKPYTSSTLGRTGGRSTYFSDYTRRSPSQLRDRADIAKETCVLC